MTLTEPLINAHLSLHAFDNLDFENLKTILFLDV